MPGLPSLKVFLILGVLLLTVASSIVYMMRGRSEDSVSRPDLAALIDKLSAPGMEHADPANCIECHREITEAWQDSHHALANTGLRKEDIHALLKASGPLPEERSMRWRAAHGTVLLEEEGLPPHPLIGTIGLTPLIQYLYLAPDGRIQTHDVAWDTINKEWFSVFESDDAGEGPRQSGEWGHWTGQGMNWDANCAYCHMTEYRKQFLPEENRYDSTWTHMGITCSQCHPGMDTHLAQIRNGNNYFKESLDKKQIMDTCATCHSLRAEITPHAFYPGEAYEDHFLLTLADVPGIYHPDGHVIGENYVYGSLTMSKMGHAGLSCLDCHDPHTNGTILPIDNNALCQRCHGSGLENAPRIDPVKHSRHPAHSTGNLCVECHMPVSYFMGRDGRRDHSFSNPDPRLTMEMGIPNVCIECHNTQSNEWALQLVEEWYGPDMNADRRAKARLMNDLFKATSGAGARLRAAIEDEKNRFWKATFIGMLQFTEPSRENLDLLTRAAVDAEPMVRAAAVRVAGLETFPESLQLDLLSDPVRSVRISASLANPLMPAVSESHDTELRQHLEHTADSPAGSLRLAAYWQSRGETGKAIPLARQAVSFDRANPEVWRLTAIELHNLGESREALDYLDKSLRIDPENALTLFNLGLLNYELGNLDEALRHLDQALSLDPFMENAWYNLVVLYWQMDRMETALQRLQTGLGHLPESRRLQELMLYFRQLNQQRRP